MAAWEAHSSGLPTGRTMPQPDSLWQLWRAGTSVWSRSEGLLLFILGTAALAAVLFGLDDLRHLVEGWPRFAAGIHNLIW